MAICSKCGNYAIDGTAVCPVCGTLFPPVRKMTPPPVPKPVASGRMQRVPMQTAQRVPMQTAQRVPMQTAQRAPMQTAQRAPMQTTQGAPMQTTQRAPMQTTQRVPGAMPSMQPVQPRTKVAAQQPATPPHVNTSKPNLPKQVTTQQVKQAVKSVATSTIPTAPSIPSIPSANSIGSMVSGSMQRAAKQTVQQFTGGIDIMATEAQGEIVLSSWKMPTNASSVVQMGASALQRATKGKYAWMWFLIPVFTILAWVISQLAK